MKMCSKLRFLFGAGLSAVHSLSYGFLIDSFAYDASHNISLNGPLESPTYVGVNAGSMLTGERDVEIATIRRNEAPVTYVAGFAHLEGFGPNYRVGGLRNGGAWLPEEAHFTLQYDVPGDEAGNLGYGRRLTNAGGDTPLFPAGLGGFRIWVYLTGTDNVWGSVILQRDGQTISELRQRLFYGAGFTANHFQFAEEDLIVADSIGIKIEIPNISNDNKEVWISHIDTILPEPTTILPTVAGLLFLGYRSLSRRRKTK